MIRPKDEAGATTKQAGLHRLPWQDFGSNNMLPRRELDVMRTESSLDLPVFCGVTRILSGTVMLNVRPRKTVKR